MRTDRSAEQRRPREGHLLSNGARLYYRHVGEGRPMVVLHGGPDLNHSYLLPEMDWLADSFHLIYYDQRGRGRSAVGVEPDDVSIESEMEDLDRIWRRFGLDQAVLLGHSWGGLLAMEYATRHRDRISHLILMNTGPASHDDFSTFVESLRRRRPAGDIEAMEAISSTDDYQRGDMAVEADLYRLHFRVAVRQPHQLEQLVDRLRSHFTEEGVVLARSIAERLYQQTWLSVGYDLTPELGELPTPTLILHGDHDLIPIEAISRIAQQVPRAQLYVLSGCGHFAYLEQPDHTQELITAFVAGHG